MDDHGCPFCSIDPKRIAFSGIHGDGIWDSFPVNPGHLLIVPRHHTPTWNDLTDVEKTWVCSTIDQAISIIKSRYSPDGFNVGFNHGPAAGQTVSHFHLHVIPHYSGDVVDPRGGIRHVIPERANYLRKRIETTLDKQRLVRGDTDPLLPHLILHMDRATTCDIAVAFLLDSGARYIREHLKDFLDRGGEARILIGDYFDITEPVALRRLNDLEGKLTLKVYETNSKIFHLKCYVFLNNSEGVAFVGSSNLSGPALTSSIEWNYKVISSGDAHGFAEIREGFESLFNEFTSVAVTEHWIEQYEQRRNPRPHELGEPVAGPAQIFCRIPFRMMRWRRLSARGRRALQPVWSFSPPVLAKRGWPHSIATVLSSVEFCSWHIARRFWIKPSKHFDRFVQPLDAGGWAETNTKSVAIVFLPQSKPSAELITFRNSSLTILITSSSMNFTMRPRPPTDASSTIFI